MGGNDFKKYICICYQTVIFAMFADCDFVFLH